MKKIIIAGIGILIVVVGLVIALQVNGKIDRDRAEKEAADKAANQAKRIEELAEWEGHRADTLRVKEILNHAYGINHPGHTYDGDHPDDAAEWHKSYLTKYATTQATQEERAAAQELVRQRDAKREIVRIDDSQRRAKTDKMNTDAIWAADAEARRQRMAKFATTQTTQPK